MSGSSSLLTFKRKDSVTRCCKIDLDRFLRTWTERLRFDDKWDSFLASDKTNKNIFKLRKHSLSYESEQLIPTKNISVRRCCWCLEILPATLSKQICFFLFED